MTFKTYAPRSYSKDLKQALAQQRYEEFCKYADFPDEIAYVSYCTANLPYCQWQEVVFNDEARKEWQDYCKEEWKKICALVASASCGCPLYKQPVAYIVIYANGGVKCGETTNLPQRYYALNNQNKIEKMFWVALNSKEQAKIAEHILQHIFGHSRGMVQQMNKKDYFDCDHDYAVSFINRNKRKMYDTIMEIKGE